MKFMIERKIIIIVISAFILTACNVKPPEKFYSEAFELREVDGEFVVFKGCNQGLKKIRLEDPQSNAVTLSNGDETVMRFYPTEVSYAKRTGLYAFDDATNMTKITAKLKDDDKVIWTVDGVETLYVFNDRASNYRYYEEDNCEAINLQSPNEGIDSDWVGSYKFDIDLYNNPETKVAVTINIHEDGTADYYAKSADVDEYIMLNVTAGHDKDYEHKGLLLNVALRSLGYREPANNSAKMNGYDIAYSDDFGIITLQNNSYYLINSAYLEERFMLDKGAEIRLDIDMEREAKLNRYG